MESQSTPLAQILTTSDEKLAHMAREESAAFAELYHRHFERVYRFLAVSCGDQADAQDLTTQTFLAALEGIETFRGDSSFLTWLLGIARNKRAMFYRSRKREIDLETAGDLIDPAPSPESLAGKRLQMQQVSRALQKIQPERAEAILLYLFSGLSASEAGQVLNKSEGAVKMLVLRGLRDLRRQLLPIQEVER